MSGGVLLRRVSGRRTIGAGVAVLCGAVAAAVAPAGAQQPGFRPVVEAARQITTDPDPTRLFVMPAVTVDPKNPSTVVVAADDVRNGGCGLYVSRDSGLSWFTGTRELLPAGYDFCQQSNPGKDLSLAFTESGRLYVAMSGSKRSEGHPNSPVSSFVARTNDLGSTLDSFVAAPSAPYNYQRPGGPAEQGFQQNSYHSIAVDPRNPNKLYLSYRPLPEGVSQPFNERPTRTMFTMSSDGGATWREPMDMLKPLDETAAEKLRSTTADLFVMDDGTVHGFTNSRGRLFHLTSTDEGKTWTHNEFGKVNLGGGARPNVAFDPRTGNFHMVWNERGTDRNDPSRVDERSPSKVYLMTSTDRGKTWSERVRVSQGPDGYNEYSPGISVAPNGRIDIAWYDFRHDPFFSPGAAAASMGTQVGERYWDVYHTYSLDKGRTWAPELRVNDRPVDGRKGATFNNMDYRAAMGVASTDDAAYIAWADSRASLEHDAEDVYFTRVRFDSDDAGGSGWSALEGAAVGGAAVLALVGLILFAVIRFRPRSEAPGSA